jgi:hypothetical protein
VRIARMEGVYFDKVKRRWFIERRVPREVHAIIGGNLKKKQTFPKTVDEGTANDLAVEIIRGWEAKWNAALPRPRMLVQHPRWARLPYMTPEMFARVQAVLARECP